MSKDEGSENLGIHGVVYIVVVRVQRGVAKSTVRVMVRCSTGAALGRDSLQKFQAATSLIAYANNMKSINHNKRMSLLRFKLSTLTRLDHGKYTHTDSMRDSTCTSCRRQC